ncbi:hypothetical protein FRB90_004852 [Tulasnella sp. 427]|nr:hypothetical protein FRB90_004852 [Tulasnella sp. 427]
MASHPPMYVVEARVQSFNPAQPAPPPATKSRGKKAKALPPPPDAWPHPATFKANPSTLAQAGFFFPDRNDPNASGIVDEVECFMCGHTLGGWEEQDDPHYEHAKRVKQTKCTWALAVCSIQSERIGKDTWRFMSSDRLPTARALDKARRGTFGTYWPHDQAGSKHGITSKKVAEAGFVFTPTAVNPDMATCPYCLTAFADWEMDDVPLSQLGDDESAVGPSRGAPRKKPSVAGKPSKVASVQVQYPPVADGTKVSRKKQAPRPPTPEEDEEMEEPDPEPEPEPEPIVKPAKKTKAATTKKTSKKVETVVEEDFDASPPPPPEPRPKEKAKAAKQVSPPEVVPAPRHVEPPARQPPPTKGKDVNKVPFPTMATPEPEVEEEVEEEEVVQSKAKPKKGAKKAPKGKKLPTKPPPKPKSPTPEPPEADEMDLDDVESASERVTEPNPEPVSEPVTEAEDASGTEASAPTDQSEPEPMEEDRPNLPLVDSGAINRASGPTKPPPSAMAKGKSSVMLFPPTKTKSPQQTPKAKAPSNTQSQTTPNPDAQSKADVRMASPEPSAPPPPPPPPEVIFTAEERKMTLIEYVRKQMQEEYERLKADGERELQGFDERAEEVRRQLEAL